MSAKSLTTGFWLSTMVGLSVPFRMWLESKSGLATLLFVKEVAMRPSPSAGSSLEAAAGEGGAIGDAFGPIELGSGDPRPALLADSGHVQSAPVAPPPNTSSFLDCPSRCFAYS